MSFTDGASGNLRNNTASLNEDLTLDIALIVSYSQRGEVFCFSIVIVLNISDICNCHRYNGLSGSVNKKNEHLKIINSVKMIWFWHCGH